MLIPMTSPRMLTSGPPELPGLIAASVWMKSVMAGESTAPQSQTLNSELAKQAADACRFPPVGRRSMGGGLQQLGFQVEAGAREVRIVGRGGEVPRGGVELFVGNAGTVARFLPPARWKLS